ncbi:MAG TPA: sugar phosphate isomerase/epimerase [Solirubrobacterales bacterium]
MHLSMHNWMRAEPIETTIARLAKYGYESIEISGEPYQYDTKEVRRYLQEYGIRCWGSITLMVEGRNLVQGSEEGREKTVQYVKDTVTMVKELDGYEVSIVPGEVGKVNPDSTPEQEWQWAVEGLREIFDHAQKEGIKLAVEPINRFETYFISRAAQAQALADAVSPEIGVCLDTFHLNIEEEDPYEAIRQAGDRLVDLHVADNNRMACGMGSYDWKRIVEILKEIGYDGALTVEFVAPIDRTPANPYPNAIETDPVDITPEQKKFIEDHGSDLLSEEFYSMLVEKCAQTLLPLIKE